MIKFFIASLMTSAKKTVFLSIFILLDMIIALEINDIYTGELPGIGYGTASWGDYDNDGDSDILMSGYTTSGSVSSIYRNDSLEFTDINAGLEAAGWGCSAWGDYDHDGDIDVVVTGKGTSSDICKIYRNDSSSFSDINAGLTGVSKGSAAWGDFDNDNDLDLLITGNTTSGAISRIYRNTSGVFSDISAGLTGVSDSSGEWGDYDHDGDLDIVITGYSTTYNSKIYRNDSGSFTDIIAGLTGVYRGTAKWCDYDKDNDLDLALTGTSSSGAVSKIYKNNLGIFSDINAGLTGVYYSSALWCDFDSDNDQDLLITGEFNDVGYYYVSTLYKNYNGNFYDSHCYMTGAAHGSLSACDYDNDGDQDLLLCGYTYANYTAQIYKNESGKLVDTGLAAVIGGSSEWGDYDNDGNLDLLMSGNSNDLNITRIYRNSSGILKDIKAGLPGINSGCTEWGDYDGDNDLDILISGDTGTVYITRIYRNDSGFFTDSGFEFPGLSESSADWGDYDNDGDLDFAIVGISQDDQYISRIYRNDGNSFVNINAVLNGAVSGLCAWGDCDNDGDLDLLLSGADFDGIHYSCAAGLYRNDSGVFTNINTSIVGVYMCSGAWGDFDNDGDLDILICGSDWYSVKSTYLYRNMGSGFMKLNPGLTPVDNGTADWGDFDCDGDPDICITGSVSSGRITKIYLNTSGGFIQISEYMTDLESSTSGCADFNNDGYLEILLSGYDNYSTSCRIYSARPLNNNQNPSAPSGLSSSVTENDAVLSWSKASDTETPQNGLSYNLYIRSDSLYAKSPLSNDSTGFRKVAGLGNINKVNSWTIKNLPDGKYYWSVQAVDHGFAGSAYAQEKSFFKGTLGIPSNVAISDDSTSVTVSWNAVQYADSYKIYASTDPYGTYTEVTSQGTFSGTTWTQTITENKLFYYVVAVSNEGKKVTTKEIKTDKIR